MGFLIPVFYFCTMKKYMLYLLILFVAFGCSSPASKEVKQNNPPLEETTLSQFFKLVAANDWPLVSAHRGGISYLGYPENCIPTFEYVLKQCPALIECDIALTKDSVLVLMHDNTLDRTTNGTGNLQDFTLKEIRQLKLEDPFGNITDFGVPTLEEVLAWAQNKTILTLDIKRNVPYQLVTDMVDKFDAANYALIITYSYGAAEKIHRLSPELSLSVNLSSQESIDKHFDSHIPKDKMLAFVGVTEPEPSIYQRLQEAGIVCMLGTLGNLDKQAKARGDDKIYPAFIQNGADILASDRPVEAYRALKSQFPQTIPDSLRQTFFSLSRQ